jgi:gliding motility-associated-like protein
MLKYFYILAFGFGLLSTITLNAQIYRDSTDCSDQYFISWIKTAGDDDVDVVNDICSDNSGNIYITGYFSNNMTIQTIDVNSYGYKDFYLAKFDSFGNLVWIETGGSIQDDEGTGLALDENGNIYVTGTYGGTASFGTEQAISLGNKDIFLLKYDNDGHYQWGTFIGGFDNDVAGEVCVDNNNNPVITGTYYFAMSIDGSSYVSSGANDFFIAKFDPTGSIQWVTTDGANLDDSGIAISCDENDNLYVTGEFAGNLDFGPIDFTAAGSKDVFLAKYSSSGSFDWAIQAGTVGDNDKAGDVVCDQNAKVYLTYKSDQVVDQAKVDIYNTSGVYSSGIGFGGSGTVHPYGITVDNSGTVYVSGMYSGITDFGDGDVNIVGGSDYFISKYNSDGSFAFKSVAGSIYVDCGSAICLDNLNNIIVGGYCNNGIYFGGVPYTAQGKEDILIVKYDSYFSFESIEVSSINCDPDNICLDIQIVGGTGPFDYYLDDVTVAYDVCGVSVGSYQIIVTDENDCYIETTIDLEAPSAESIDMPTDINSCFHDTTTLDAGLDYVDYLWSTPGAETTQTIDVLEAGSYTVTVTDENLCTTSATINVSELPDEDLFATNILYMCQDMPLTYQVVGYTEYLWFDGSTSDTYEFDEGGDFSLMAYDGSCYFYDTLTIIEYPKPSVDLGGDVFVCDGDSVQLFAGVGFDEYLWQDDSTEESFWAVEAGPVSVVVTDDNGCEASDAITVSFIELESIELGPDASICTNDPIILDPQDQQTDNTYSWSNGLTTSTITVIITGQYWVEVTNSEGCSSYDTISLTIYPQPIVDLGDDISFCEGGSDTLRVIGDFYTYIWNNDAETDYLYVDVSGQFSVTATDVNGCFDSDTIIVFESNITLPFLGFDTTLCTEVIYRLETMDDYYLYLWQNGSSESFTNISEPGLYSLTVTDEVGCTASSSVNIDYEDGPVIQSVDSGSGQVSVAVVGGTKPYIFSNDGGTWQTENYFTLLPSGFHAFYVMDENYCMDTIETFLEERIDIPNFFTPNGDGYNDYWVIYGLYQYPTAVVKIFDRYGKEVYDFSGSEVGWNGKYMGIPLASDTYWYSIKLESSSEPLTGPVTIKR